jgi:hypothetical protein
MISNDNPYKFQIEYDNQTEENPFNPNIHKSRNDFTIITDALGVHTGYYRLCIIREKEGNWKEVARLAEQAKSEGWAGDWDKRIEKARKKIEGKK